MNEVHRGYRPNVDWKCGKIRESVCMYWPIPPTPPPSFFRVRAHPSNRYNIFIFVEIGETWTGAVWQCRRWRWNLSRESLESWVLPDKATAGTSTVVRYERENCGVHTVLVWEPLHRTHHRPTAYAGCVRPYVQTTTTTNTEGLIPEQRRYRYLYHVGGTVVVCGRTSP